MHRKRLRTILRFLLEGSVRSRPKTSLKTSKNRGRQQYLAHKEAARDFVDLKLKTLNMYYGFSYGRVAIRDQQSRWGSCSKKGNLNFNYRLLYLPEPLADLVIVHELCHLKEFNHSADFWKLVAETIPDFEIRRKALSRVSPLIMGGAIRAIPL